MEKPLIRWTIGPVTPLGFECFQLSLDSVTKFYDADIAICYNCDPSQLKEIAGLYPQATLIDQRSYLQEKIPPAGVAWKLYPPRLDDQRHEICIDNDIVLNEKIPQIDLFLSGNMTLLLEDWSRTYGRFERHVPEPYRINSGLYGMPPKFSLQKYLDFYVHDEWEMNAVGEYKESKTFDEQGLIALSLLDYPKFTIIPELVLTNCERNYVEGAGHHFIGVNRKIRHRPFALYKQTRRRTFL